METRRVCKTCMSVYEKKPPKHIRWYHTDIKWHIAPRMRRTSLCGLLFLYDNRGFSKSKRRR